MLISGATHGSISTSVTSRTRRCRLDLLVLTIGIPSTDARTTTYNLSNTATKKSQDLAEKLIALGYSGQVAYIPQIITYTTYPDSQIRQSVASALGTIAAFQGIKPEIKRVIPLLGKLSRDPDPLLRQSAVEALGKIKSERVISLLRQALRDANLNVVKAASAALSKFKLYSMSPGKKSVKVFSNSPKR
ncbi:MAG: HEAT repeat domain-containing protein [Coleofasciculus sp. Co-bin14]|nr:HEAT repeat domain-containing protein [Coleofasciculus sp. Co-bin14]